MYEFWQYWRNTEDADVERFLKLFTTLPLDEIARVVGGVATDINEAKKVLATEVTALVHGRAAAEEAAAAAVALFEAGQLDLSLPTIQIGWSALRGGLGILAAAVTANLANSNSEARRHIQAGALKVNDETVTDDKLALGEEHVLSEGVIKLSIGKKRHVLLKPV